MREMPANSNEAPTARSAIHDAMTTKVALQGLTEAGWETPLAAGPAGAMP
jgi:hypothetical protein